MVLVFVFALGVFTALTVRDAGQSTVRPVAGGTFTGRDVDGRLVQVCLFEQGTGWPAGGWQGWLYREGREQTEWFTTTNRAHPWHDPVNVREREDVPKLPEPVVTSTDDPLRLNATVPRTNGWASDTANLARQFEHLSFRRRTGLRLGQWGGTLEFRAQFPRLPEGDPFAAAVTREILRQCETESAEFMRSGPEFWRDMIRERQLHFFNQHELSANWQLRLLTTNLASFCVWSYDAVGGNGNHSHWQGANFMSVPGGLRELKLAELLSSAQDWQAQVRARCVPKLRAIGVREGICNNVTDPDTVIETFTLSPTGLQIYFNPYAIASGADGEFVVHFDYAELKDLLRDDGPARWLPRGK